MRHVENRQFAATVPAFNLSHLHLTHLAPPLVMTPFEFCRDLWHQKTSVLDGVVCIILRFAISVEHRLVTDGQTTANTHAS